MTVLSLRGRLALAALLASALAGCGVFGGKNPPDEFVVVSKQPLTVPPDFQLRPPRPGEPQPQQIQPADRVINALFPGQTKAPPRPSAGEQALLSNLPSTRPDVRSQVGDDTQIVDKGPFLPDILAMQERDLASDGAMIERVGSEPIEP